MSLKDLKRKKCSLIQRQLQNGVNDDSENMYVCRIGLDSQTSAKHKLMLSDFYYIFIQGRHTFGAVCSRRDRRKILKSIFMKLDERSKPNISRIAGKG